MKLSWTTPNPVALAILAGLCLILTVGQPDAAATVNTNPAALSVRDCGAAGGGATLDTKAIQSAIDAATGAGGGTVRFPAGRYLSGTIFLKSNVTIHLDPGATLLGSTKLDDFPRTTPTLRSYTDDYTERSLIYAEGAENIAIEGRGTIDGQGAAFPGPYKVRPYMIRVIACKNVAVRDVTIKDSPMWVQHYLACEGVLIDGVTVHSRVNHNNDGIDIDGCERVRIANCDIWSGDDAIVLKSTLDRPCRDVTVTNCSMSTLCNAFKLGTESNGGFEGIVMNNCTIYDTRLAGIALELVDGGKLDGVAIDNVTMRDTRCPIFIRLGNRARPFKEGMAQIGQGSLRNITISNVIATGADKTGCSITGLPGAAAENITLSNVAVSFVGGGTDADAKREVPEQETKYPEYRMFGTLPAYGYYVRHVRGLRLINCRVDFEKPEARPALVCDDVAGLELAGWQAKAPAPGGSPVMLGLRNVRDAFIHGCRAPRGAAAFLGIEGAESARIKLMENDLPAAMRESALGGDVRPAALKD